MTLCAIFHPSGHLVWMNKKNSCALAKPFESKTTISTISAWSIEEKEEKKVSDLATFETRLLQKRATERQTRVMCVCVCVCVSSFEIISDNHDSSNRHHLATIWFFFSRPRLIQCKKPTTILTVDVGCASDRIIRTVRTEREHTVQANKICCLSMTRKKCLTLSRFTRTYRVSDHTEGSAFLVMKKSVDALSINLPAYRFVLIDQYRSGFIVNKRGIDFGMASFSVHHPIFSCWSFFVSFLNYPTNSTQIYAQCPPPSTFLSTLYLFNIFRVSPFYVFCLVCNGCCSCCPVV